jgi:putative serine protease PepD
VTRTLAPLAAAALVGGGAGAGVYALSSSSQSTPAPTAAIGALPVSAATSNITSIWERSRAGVVDITVKSTPQVGPLGTSGGGTAEGSGFVLDKAGHIVTNAHVVDGAGSITVHLTNAESVKAKLVGVDASSDLAVLKVDVPASRLDALPLGSSASVDVGEGVVAIGSPFGLPGTVTAGIVSAVNRTIQAPNGYSIPNAVQTDAAINHGNSGGPLLDTSGRVIGVNAQIESDSGGNDGVGFAIPVDTVKRVTSAIVAGKAVEHAYLGVRIGNSQQGTAGALVGSVQSGTPAASAGLRQGDVITAINGRRITSADELTAAIGARQPGSVVKLTVSRGGSTLTLTATLGSRPA